MKSKGPVDFFLGVFLEFGAAFCLLFFLPQVPWHWLPEEGIIANERRTTLLPSEPALLRPKISLRVPVHREAPALLPAATEPTMPTAASAPLASHQPDPPVSFYRRDLPRQYRY